MRTTALRSCALAAVSLTALAASAGLAAAQQATPQEATVEEVVVTAAKRAQDVQDVPSAVAVVGGAEIAEFQLQTFTDLSRLDPSIQFSSAGVGDSRIIVRGIQSGGAATVALYLDEAVITGQTFETAVGGSQPDIGLHDIARVEVLKGPQGTLFGASAMSGAVRIITNKPDLNEYGGSLMAGGSWGDGTNGLYETEAVANIPVVEDVLGVRLVGWYSDGGGYIDNASSGETDVNDATIGGVRGTALWQANDRLTLTLTGIYQDIEVDGTQRYQAALGPYYNDSPTLEPYEEDLRLFSAVLDYDVGVGTVTAASSYFDRNTDFFNDSTPTAAGFGLPGAYGVLESAERSIWSSELRFASDFDGPFQIVAGGSYQKDDNFYENVVSQTELNTRPACGRFATCQAAGLATSIVSARNVNSEFSAWAVFAEGEYELTETLTLVVGVRQYGSEQDNTEYTLQGLRPPFPNVPVQTTPTLAVDESVENEKTSFNFAARYEPSSDLTFYARAASGFRQGGINNAAFAANFGTEIPAGFGPDEVWNYEAGAKGVALDGMLSFEAAVFHIDWKDQQVPAVSENGAFTFTTNAGKSVVNGVELEGVLRPVDGLTLSSGLTYTDSHLTEDQPPTDGDENAPGKDGDRLPYVSKWAWTGTAEYEWPSYGEWQGYARANASYRSRAYTFFNTDNPFYRPVGDYFLADAAVGMRTERVDISFMVRNVTDEKAELSAEVTPDGYRIFTVRPRTFGVTVRANF